jgi:ubiquitin carboxyl-terminal hydrolase 25/28
VDTSSYREPELVTDDSTPDLPEDSDVWYKGPTQWDSNGDWHETVPSYRNNKSWDNNADNSNWSAFDGVDNMVTSYTKRIAIDGRDENEEVNWWDAAVREKANRPGSGMLPPVLAETLHNAEHALFSVSVTPPDIKIPETAASGHPSTSNIDARSQSPSVSAANAPSSHVHIHSPLPPPPSADDVYMAVPHPNAYYCPKENGWVLLIWKQSSVFPPLAKSFLKTSHQPLPDQNRRKLTGSCIGQAEQPFGQVNLTHHFHMYQKAIDASKLNPPFCRRAWEKVERVKQKRRAMAIDMDELNMEKIQSFADECKMQEDISPEKEEEEEGDLLDLYVCCQCSVYCVASGIIPGVIPRKVHEEFVRDKREHPTVGRTGEMAIMVGWQTVIKYAQVSYFCAMY